MKGWYLQICYFIEQENFVSRIKICYLQMVFPIISSSKPYYFVDHCGREAPLWKRLSA